MSKPVTPSLTPSLTPHRSLTPSRSLTPGNELRHERTPSPGRVAYSTGRGGAGNIKHGDEVPLPTEGEVGESIPKITQKIYTTGRGGIGNMRENKDEHRTRIAQDVDGGDFDNDPFPIKSNSSIGRGGYGNVHAARNQESLLKKARKLFRN